MGPGKGRVALDKHPVRIVLTHEQTPAEQPDHFEGRCRNTVWKGNNKNHPDNSDDQFFPVYKLATQSITNKPKQKLTEDISYVCRSIHQATQT